MSPLFTEAFTYFLARLLSAHCTEGLTALSLRWVQPSQQHGRRIPSFSSLTTLLTWSFLVSSLFTKVTQQIHSLRASGVRSSHSASAFASELKAFRISGVSLCAVPPEIFFIIKLEKELISNITRLHFSGPLVIGKNYSAGCNNGIPF